MPLHKVQLMSDRIAEGHEQVMNMAADLQGCPVTAAWKADTKE